MCCREGFRTAGAVWSDEAEWCHAAGATEFTEAVSVQTETPHLTRERDLRGFIYQSAVLKRQGLQRRNALKVLKENVPNLVCSGQCSGFIRPRNRRQ